MGLREVERLIHGVPFCPMCDGPCTHDLPRGPFQIGGNMPHIDGGTTDERKNPPKVKKPNRRGKRAVHGPEEDRMIRGPQEDRSK